LTLVCSISIHFFIFLIMYHVFRVKRVLPFSKSAAVLHVSVFWLNCAVDSRGTSLNPGCQIFLITLQQTKFWRKIPKYHKICKITIICAYQMLTKYTKLPLHISNVSTPRPFKIIKIRNYTNWQPLCKSPASFIFFSLFN
jgi:hypothetical protein